MEVKRDHFQQLRMTIRKLGHFYDGGSRLDRHLSDLGIARNCDSRQRPIPDVFLTGKLPKMGGGAPLHSIPAGRLGQM